MSTSDAIAQSFIIRIWIEESATRTQPAVWRGSVTHVPSGATEYIQDLSRIAAIIAPYLTEMGVNNLDETCER